MNEPLYPTTPPDVLPPLDGKPKPPILGIASLVAAILSMLSVCAFLLFAYYLGSQTQSGNTANVESISLVGWVFICLTALTGLAGIGLGIAAVFQKDSNKVFGIIGLVLSSLVLIGFCIFMVFAFSLAFSMAGGY